MNNAQYVGMVIGCIGLVIGLWVNWPITIAVFLMMYGENIIQDFK